MDKNYSISEIQALSVEVRKKFLQLHYEAGVGHIGSGLSCIDLLLYLYLEGLDPNDEFILSKGHAASALYVVLNHVGRLSDECLLSYMKSTKGLLIHPTPLKLKDIPLATGSLGHGLSFSVGAAYAAKYLCCSEGRWVCLLSDGECNAGAVWEAALFANQHQLDNLCVIIDANRLQGFGSTDKVMTLEPLQDKWKAFGFDVFSIDGHNFSEIRNILSHSIINCSGKPICIVANTVKGKGVSFLENRLESHYLPINRDQYVMAVKELDKR